LNRIVQYYAKRPQVQERLTNQIAEDLKSILSTDDVAVIIDAKHLCVSSRGIKDETSATVTSYYGGQFNTPSRIAELQNYL
jgi:GTP cyclohydrolase I